MAVVRRQQICRVVYRDAKGRFVRPPERPAKVKLQPVPQGVRVHKGGEVVAITETPFGVRVRFVPDAKTRQLIREAREKGDRQTLRQIREWEREVKRLAAEDYLRAKRAKEWSARMEEAKRGYDAAKGGKAAAANRRKIAELASRFREESTATLIGRYQVRGGDPLEKRAIAKVLKERGIEVPMERRRKR